MKHVDTSRLAEPYRQTGSLGETYRRARAEGIDAGFNTVKKRLVQAGVHVPDRSNVAFKAVNSKACLGCGGPMAGQHHALTVCRTCAPDEKARSIFKHHGLTAAQHRKLLERQGHRCRICDRDLNELKGTVAAIDHCHSTGRVRGVLCRTCNVGLHLLEDPFLRARAMAYLNNPHD